ncbi:MAG: DNA topoisomerase, partial [Nanoarchaeota archaeon]|nr:DNA topoisomerase [Nanoarchaeota archaeon]
FNVKGVNVREKGWMEVYPYKIEENEIPDLEGKVKVKNVEIEEKFTQPPKRYTPASIISLLEKKNLGTKATRSSIIETLYNRSYVKDRAITATSLGISLINSLEKNCKIIIDEDLTRDIEKKLDCIRSSKNPGNEMKKVIEETKKAINKIGKEFEKNKEKIGKDLVDATTKLWEQERKDAELMICDKCKKGKLAIKYNRRDKRYFVACNNYPECKTTYSLPPNGVIKKTGKECEECGWPMLMLLRKGRKPWIFCFNPECESKKKD